MYISEDLKAAIGRLYNIPEELRKLPQWVCWKLEDIGASKPTKVPYTPNNQHASTTNKNTWASFEDCLRAYASGHFSGVGFVFSADDPYSFIDLDDTAGDALAFSRQHHIFKTFNSYSEISPSGKGLHIIIKGNVPVGRKRSFVEIYSSGRYATFTGNVHLNEPIKECQPQLISLWEQMGASIPKTMIFTGDKDEKQTDEEIIRTAASAINGDKFNQLFIGNWQSAYKSQSEADFALIDIIAFYTQNRTQIARLFRSSGLGKRDKAKRQDYLDYMINQSFDRMLPDVDIEGLNIDIDKLKNGSVAQSVEPKAHNFVSEGSSPSTPTNSNEGVSRNGSASGFGPEGLGSIPNTPINSIPEFTDISSSPSFTLNPPPGLVGEIAQFIYQASPRPVPEIALAGALGLMSGIVGRAYNVSATGLNQYILLLAATGSGKEGLQAGISKLMSHVRQQVPTATNFLGPSEIASGQALFKYISNTSQSFVSILGEFGLRLMAMANVNANGAEVSLRRIVLDLYNKSGHKDVVQPSIYADKDKNVGGIQAPAFSICGESTPERFYGNLNEDMISEGLLPRFLMIEYTGPRVPFNESHSLVEPTFSLIDKLTQLAAICETVNNANPRRVVTVELDNEAKQLSQSYDRYCDRQINTTNKDVIRHLWNRAHIKVLKLSATVAVGINPINPLITANEIKWAMDLVNHDIKNLTNKFEEGKVGSNTLEVRQIEEVIRAIKDYVMSDWEHVKKYADKKGEGMHRDKVVPYTYLSRKLIMQSSFKNDRLGSTNAIKRCLQIMTERDYLREIGSGQLSQKYGFSGKAYAISNNDILK